MWTGIVCRTIRRVVGDSDLRTTGSSETSSRLALRITPSKDSTTSQFGQILPHIHDPLDFIVGIRSERTHVNMAYNLEYCIEIDPSRLVAATESGIKGKRTADDVDVSSLANEDDDTLGYRDNEHIAVHVSRAQRDPSSRLQMWIPGCMIGMTNPRLIAEYNERKLVKTATRPKKTRKRKREHTTGVRDKGEFDWQKWSKKC